MMILTMRRKKPTVEADQLIFDPRSSPLLARMPPRVHPLFRHARNFNKTVKRGVEVRIGNIRDRAPPERGETGADFGA